MTKPKYRRLECYRLMSQIGICQLFVTPSVFCGGLMHATNYDHLGIGTFTSKIFANLLRLEAMLSFVLALNRLKIICGFQYPTWVHTVVLACAYTYNLTIFVSMLTPWVGYVSTPGKYASFYDFSKPYSWLVADMIKYSFLATLFATLLSYTSMVIYLIWVKKGAAHIKNFKQEKQILFNALVRFGFDMVLAVTYHIIRPTDNLIRFFMALTYFFNMLLVSPVLYLCMSCSLREDFMTVFKNNRTSVIATTSQSRDTAMSQSCRASNANLR
ncbi:hypothetical protein L596_026718 [Steinernema carpocapsae]|nr:hypothetical protein L596_026718 [Steinernema carpocapsae]